jgi:hypothetical protein
VVLADFFSIRMTLEVQVGLLLRLIDIGLFSNMLLNNYWLDLGVISNFAKVNKKSG